MFNHPIFVFLSLILAEHVMSFLGNFLAKIIFSDHSNAKKTEMELDELSPLRNEIQEQEKKGEILREELINLTREAEKINTPKTFALYSKMQRKCNMIKEKIEEIENSLQKMRGENENLKIQRKSKKNNAEFPNQEQISQIDNQQKTKILVIFFHLVSFFKNNFKRICIL